MKKRQVEDSKLVELVYFKVDAAISMSVERAKTLLKKEVSGIEYEEGENFIVDKVDPWIPNGSFGLSDTNDGDIAMSIDLTIYPKSPLTLDQQRALICFGCLSIIDVSNLGIIHYKYKTSFNWEYDEKSKSFIPSFSHRA